MEASKRRENDDDEERLEEENSEVVIVVSPEPQVESYEELEALDSEDEEDGGCAALILACHYNMTEVNWVCVCAVRDHFGMRLCRLAIITQ